MKRSADTYRMRTAFSAIQTAYRLGDGLHWLCEYSGKRIGSVELGFTPIESDTAGSESSVVPAGETKLMQMPMAASS